MFESSLYGRTGKEIKRPVTHQVSLRELDSELTDSTFDAG